MTPHNTFNKTLNISAGEYKFDIPHNLQGEKFPTRVTTNQFKVTKG